MSVFWQLVARIVLAAILGAVIGIERTRAGQTAGMRTNIMIAIASCLFTFLGIEAFVVEGAGPRDPARIAAQIVTGVGFLGAGTMLQTKNKVRGLTTAATIWLVAAIGMAAGVGFYSGAIFVTVFAVIVLMVLAPMSKHLAHEAEEERQIRKQEEQEAREALKRWWNWRTDDDHKGDDSGTGSRPKEKDN